MKESAILFTPENIRAIHREENPKTQTRRVMRLQPHAIDQRWEAVEESERYPGEWFQWYDGGSKMPIRPCPYGVPGDRLYIKEGVIVHASIQQLCGYYMDGCRATEAWEKRLTAMFMPKWAARTWLEITDVRAERVQDISEEDALAEGMQIHENPNCEIGVGRYMYTAFPGDHSRWELNAKTVFRELWESINAKKHPFKSNPHVWVISFRRLEQ